MFYSDHLHIDRDDPVGIWLSTSLRSIRGGAVTIALANESAARIVADDGRIAVDLLRPEMFKIPDDDTGLFDKLKTASEFGRKLSDSGMTISFLRKGKEAIRLGKDAKPTVSKLITRSDDIQLNSVREFSKLKSELKTD